MRMFLAAALGSAMLAACSTTGTGDPSVVSSTPVSNTIRFIEGDLNNATNVAQQLCSVHGKSATLQTVTPTQGAERLASFSCT